MTDATPAAPSYIEFLVHGTLGPAVVVPANHHPIELWVDGNEELEMFAVLVGKQCGATIVGNRLWLFRPVDLPVNDNGQTVVMKKMLAFDGGLFPSDELRQIRSNGIKLRRKPDGSNPLTGLLIVTPGDVVDMPAPILFSQVMFSSAKPTGSVKDRVQIQPSVIDESTLTPSQG